MINSDCHPANLIPYLKEMQIMVVLKVAAKSNPNSIAGALAGTIREQGMAEMQAIGAGAINQATLKTL